MNSNPQSICIVPAPYPDVLVAFSARGVPKGKFTFWNILKDFPANIIYVNDYDTGWYLSGTPDFKSSQELTAFLQKEISKLRKNGGRLFTLGSSMGGYAALKYGSSLGADKVLSFGPESEVCIPLGRSVTSLVGYREGDENIARVPFKDKSEVLIISGNNDIVDFYCACKFQHANPKIDILMVNNCTHTVTEYLHKACGLQSLLKEFFFPKLPGGVRDLVKNVKLGSTTDVTTATALKLFNEKLSNKKVDVSFAKTIENVAQRFPIWSMAQFFAGMIQLELKNPDGAIQYFRQSLTAEPGLVRSRYRLAQTLFQNGKVSEAVLELEKLVPKKNSLAITELLTKAYLELGRLGSAAGTLENGLNQLKLNDIQRNKITNELVKIGTQIARTYKPAAST